MKSELIRIMEKVVIDEKLVDEKSRQINGLLEGMRVPEVFATLSCSVLNLVANICCDYEGFSDIAHDWISDLAEKVLMIEEMEDETDLSLN